MALYKIYFDKDAVASQIMACSSKIIAVRFNRDMIFIETSDGTTLNYAEVALVEGIVDEGAKRVIAET